MRTNSRWLVERTRARRALEQAIEEGDTLGAMDAAERFARCAPLYPSDAPVFSVGQDPGTRSLQKQSYLGMYAQIEIWAMSEFGGEEHEDNFYPSIWGPPAEKVFRFYEKALERVILEVVAPGEGFTDIGLFDLTDTAIGKMPKGTESQLGKMNALEMEWRPYWTTDNESQHGPQIQFWQTLHELSKWLDIWSPAGHRVKSLVLPIHPGEPDVDIEKKKKKKKKKGIDGLIILILLAAVYLTRKKN